MNRLQRYFSDNWAIRRQDYENGVAMLLPSIIRGRLDMAETMLHDEHCSAAALASPYVADEWDADDPELPADSVLLLRMRGTLYSWETEWLIQTVEAAEANDKIAGIVLDIDGPGGMVSHVDQAAAQLRCCSKPVATLVSGLMASAHFWIGTSTGRTFVASPLCEVGSVGVLTSYMSLKKYFQKQGIDCRDIYPDTADLKNREWRALEDEGDEAPVKAKLETIHKAFASYVATNLKIKYDPELDLFRGATYMGDEAVRLGYADQMGTLADAVQWVLGKATSAKAAQLY